MKKYYLKNGKEVKIGDKIVCKKTEQSEYGNTFIKRCFLVTESSLPYLVKMGVISCKEERTGHNDIMPKILNKFSKLLDFNTEDTLMFLSTIYKINESAFRSIMYKKIAVEFDRVYPDYIADAKEIWIINTMYNIVDMVSVDKNIDFKNFAAFRTEEDAKKAIELVNNFIKHYSDSNQ